MKTVPATELKNRLGAVLARAAFEPVAIERHGRIVALLVPPPAAKPRAAKRAARPPRWGRREEARVVELCAQGDFRPSRWRRAGEVQTLAGIAAMLASQDGFDRARMLGLAERLHPGMSTPTQFARWLARSPVQATRFLPQLAARLRGTAPASP